MTIDAAVIEYCEVTGLYVGHIPGIAGAHSQGATVQELFENLNEVLDMLRESAI